MRKIKKMMALALAMVMVLAMSTAVFAQDIGGTQAASGKGQITVSNAAKGETYTIYKLFDATLGENGEVAYTGTIPNALSDYFQVPAHSTGSNYVEATAAAGSGDQMSDGLKAALKTWASTAANAGTAVSDGTELHFNNLDYGYYVVTTTQGEQLISVDTTMPLVTINDKNTTTITAVKKVNGKDVDSASIGETVTYTATFVTKNYVGDEQVKSYTIKDTLPEFLSDIAITEVKVIQTTDDTQKTTYPDVDLSSSYTAFTNKQIVIPWVGSDGTTSLYKNGSTISITYTAKITSKAVVDGGENTGNTNTVEITPNKDSTGDEPFEEHANDDATVKTYGAALKKVDGSSHPLKGAEFSIADLSVEAVAGEPGVYRVVEYKSGNTSGNLTTNDNGELYIIGLKENLNLTVTEEKAPDGYNKLTGTATLTPQVLSESIWTKSEDRYFDAKGNLVSESSSETTTTTVQKNYTDLEPQALKIVNEKGTELPSTGGIGTTIFYIIGAILVIGAGVLLVTRRRMSAN